MNPLQIAVTWVAVALSLALAVALPWITHRRLSRPETLREMWLYSRRGTVLAACVVGAALLICFGALTALGAVIYPALWSTVALITGALVSVLMMLIRYVRYDPSEFRQHEYDSSDEDLT